MASIINASVASSGIVSTADASGILQVQSNGKNTNAQAWVQFVGANPATINSSYNVSSVTYQSTGRYYITFTNSFPDAYYVYAGTASPTTDLNINIQTGLQSSYGTNTSSVCYLAVGNSAATQPAAFVNVVFFR